MGRFLLFVFFVFSYEGFGQSLKFHYDQSLIFIPLTVNNTSLLFLLNTGANTTVIDEEAAERLNLPVVKEKDTVTGTAGRQPVQLVKLQTVTLGKTTLKDLTVSRRSIESFIELNGQKADGILGTDILKNFAFTIDYKAHKISFQSTKIPVGKKKVIAFEMNEGIPCLEMRLNDTFTTCFHYNSGVSLAPDNDIYINIAPKQWDTVKRLCNNLGSSKYFTGKGVGGNVYLQAVKMRCIALHKRQKIYNAYIIVQPKEGYFRKENAIGFFGNNLLEKYGTVSVDFIAGQIMLPEDQPPPVKKAKKKKRRR